MKFFNIPLTKNEWATVIGWLRNGNYTSGELADRIEEKLNKNLRVSDTTAYVPSLTKDILELVDRLDNASLREIKEAKDYCRDLGHDYATRPSRRRLYKKMATLLRAELPKGVKIT